MHQEFYPPPPIEIPLGMSEEDFELLITYRHLKHCNWNRYHASRMMGISVRTVRTRIQVMKLNGWDVPDSPKYWEKAVNLAAKAVKKKKSQRRTDGFRMNRKKRPPEEIEYTINLP